MPKQFLQVFDRHGHTRCAMGSSALATLLSKQVAHRALARVSLTAFVPSGNSAPLFFFRVHDNSSSFAVATAI